MSNQNDIIIQSLESMAANVQAYLDERVVNDVVDSTQLDRKIETLLRQKLGETTIVPPNFNAPPAVSAVNTATVSTAEPTVDLRNLKGMCPNTGTLLTGIKYLKSRIEDALHTPKRSQVLLRARGSDVDELIDSPQNQQGGLAIMAAYAQAIAHPLSGVPDFILTRIKFLLSELSGKQEVLLAGKWLGSDVEIIL